MVTTLLQYGLSPGRQLFAAILAGLLMTGWHRRADMPNAQACASWEMGAFPGEKSCRTWVPVSCSDEGTSKPASPEEKPWITHSNGLARSNGYV
jgi:hypothetical protein